MTGSGLAVLSLCDIRKRFQAPSRLLERPARGLIRRPRRNARPARLRQVSISRPRRGCALPLDWCARGGPQRRRSAFMEARGSELAVARQRQFNKSRRGTDGPAPGTSYCGEIGFVAGRAVSFQITILKVLAGHPDGRASIAELTRYVSILMSSGSDWSDRMRRLSARAPKLAIFADALVLRDDRGWCITDWPAVPGFAGSACPRSPARERATVRTRRAGRYRTDPSPADASTGCRQHAHLAARSRPG
jgi:hypothetical protein